MRGQRRRASCERPPGEWRILPRRFTKIVPFTANASGLGASFGHCSTMTTLATRCPRLARSAFARVIATVSASAATSGSRRVERTLLGLDRAKAQGTTLGARSMTVSPHGNLRVRVTLWRQKSAKGQTRLVEFHPMFITLVAILLLSLSNNCSASTFCGRKAYFHG